MTAHETVALWAETRAQTIRFDVKHLLDWVGAVQGTVADRMARVFYVRALERCAAIMDACAQDLRDPSPILCKVCGTTSPQNMPCTGCGATACG
jgi:hypothetical protein